ncbi:hypothetical protein Q0M94_10125 [Deinococcus radiomollis]|uniref:hypothetical protein n=1 Tax=Deinococcus radiomollis TaxID=468916 RepID=UPI003891342D
MKFTQDAETEKNKGQQGSGSRQITSFLCQNALQRIARKTGAGSSGEKQLKSSAIARELKKTFRTQ